MEHINAAGKGKSERDAKKGRFTRAALLGGALLAGAACHYTPYPDARAHGDAAKRDAALRDGPRKDGPKPDALRKDLARADRARDSLKKVDIAHKADSKADASKKTDATKADTGPKQDSVTKPDSASIKDGGVKCSSTKTGSFTGFIGTSSPLNVAGYEFRFNGVDASGAALISIRCAEGAIADNLPCPVGKETDMARPSDGAAPAGRTLKITPSSASSSSVTLTISVTNP